MCDKCQGQMVHRSEPSNEPCPLCEKRMSLNRTLKLSKLAKLHELKSILNKPDPPDIAA